MDKITVIIHSYPSYPHIEETLESARLLTNQIILIPSPDFEIVETRRASGIRKAKTRWVFLLDADERITPELAKEIKEKIKDSSYGYYQIPRKEILFRSHWLKYGGWWPNYQTRLIQTALFVDWPKYIHSTPIIKGKKGFLSQPMIHYSQNDFSDIVNRTIIFEDNESKLLLKAKRAASTMVFFRKFCGELLRRLIWRQGFRDGTIGIIESIYQAFSKTITYLFLYEKSLLAGRQVGLYTPYLDILGGGEKYILSILKVFDDHGDDINIFWDKDLSAEIKTRLNLTFKNLVFVPNTFKKKTFFSSTLRTLQILKTYDYFFYVTDGSYFFSTAKKNFIYAMIPDRKLYDMNFLNRVKLLNFKFITHSKFAQKQLGKFGVESEVVLPYLNDDFINFQIYSLKKQKIILSVGRFFKHLHAKRQDIIIKMFKNIKTEIPALDDFKLILAGGLKREDKDYLDELKKITGNDSSIIFKPNVSYNELLSLYQKSLIFWHFTGYGIDENKHPELVEHLGITPIEAMASGCITFCYNAGGPKEIIKDGETGFLFADDKDLVRQMTFVLNRASLQNKILTNAKKYVKENFSYEVFKKRVISFIP